MPYQLQEPQGKERKYAQANTHVNQPVSGKAMDEWVWLGTYKLFLMTNSETACNQAVQTI